MSEQTIIWIFGSLIFSISVVLGILYDRINKAFDKLAEIEVDLEQRATREWIEDTFQKNIEDKIEVRHRENMTLSQQSNTAILEMHDAMVGTLNKRGFITVMDRRLQRLEERVDALCEVKGIPKKENGPN